MGSPFFDITRAWVWGCLLAWMVLTGCCAGQYNGDTSLELPKGSWTQFQGTHYLLRDLVANVCAHGQGLERHDL